eukprot:SAG31_NODE_11518_length_1021_cov_2.732104_2_plen_176_part_01
MAGLLRQLGQWWGGAPPPAASPLRIPDSPLASPLQVRRSTRVIAQGAGAGIADQGGQGDVEPESQGPAPGDASLTSSATERRTAADCCASPNLQQLGLLETRPTVCFGANFEWHRCGQDPGTIGHADVPCLGAAGRIYAMTPAWADAIRSGWAEQFAGHARPLRKELLEPGVGLCE